jgi:four helix bundle protein
MQNRHTDPPTPTTTPTPERPLPEAPADFKPGPFPHHSLDAYWVAREALVLGDRIARGLPRGYAKLADQLRRALLGGFLNVAEAAARSGADRRNRFQIALGETSEAHAASDAVLLLDLSPTGPVNTLRQLLARLAAMLCRLAQRAR